eukprot:m.8939 g.8939  ORF g.8939 m.8939 type:complete len:672 (-) comp3980_c0_seq1:475-2490(-)
MNAKQLVIIFAGLISITHSQNPEDVLSCRGVKDIAACQYQYRELCATSQPFMTTCTALCACDTTETKTTVTTTNTQTTITQTTTTRTTLSESTTSRTTNSVTVSTKTISSITTTSNSKTSGTSKSETSTSTSSSSSTKSSSTSLVTKTTYSSSITQTTTGVCWAADIDPEVCDLFEPIDCQDVSQQILETICPIMCKSCIWTIQVRVSNVIQFSVEVNAYDSVAALKATILQSTARSNTHNVELYFLDEKDILSSEANLRSIDGFGMNSIITAIFKVITTSTSSTHTSSRTSTLTTSITASTTSTTRHSITWTVTSMTTTSTTLITATSTLSTTSHTARRLTTTQFLIVQEPSTQDPCSGIICGYFCQGNCGWKNGQCVTGENTSPEEELFGQCPPELFATTTDPSDENLISDGTMTALIALGIAVFLVICAICIMLFCYRNIKARQKAVINLTPAYKFPPRSPRSPTHLSQFPVPSVHSLNSSSHTIQDNNFFKTQPILSPTTANSLLVESINNSVYSKSFDIVKTPYASRSADGMYLELHTATPHATVLFTVDGSDPKPSKVQSPKLVATGETSLSDSFSGVYSGISEKKIESQSREQIRRVLNDEKEIVEYSEGTMEYDPDTRHMELFIPKDKNGNKEYAMQVRFMAVKEGYLDSVVCQHYEQFLNRQ